MSQIDTLPLKLDYEFDISKLTSDLNKITETYDLTNQFLQFCFTHRPGIEGEQKRLSDGVGSLYYEWVSDPDLEVSEEPKRRTPPLDEADFSVFNEAFVDTYFYDVYKALSKKYQLGRFRIMGLGPKNCLSWHADDYPRVHIPIVSSHKCQLVFEGRSIHLEADGSAYFCDTTIPHTAFNADNSLLRYHLVTDVIKTI